MRLNCSRLVSRRPSGTPQVSSSALQLPSSTQSLQVQRWRRKGSRGQRFVNKPRAADATPGAIKINGQFQLTWPPAGQSTSSQGGGIGKGGGGGLVSFHSPPPQKEGQWEPLISGGSSDRYSEINVISSMLVSPRMV